MNWRVISNVFLGIILILLLILARIGWLSFKDLNPLRIGPSILIVFSFISILIILFSKKENKVIKVGRMILSIAGLIGITGVLLLFILCNFSECGLGTAAGFAFLIIITLFGILIGGIISLVGILRKN